MPRIELIDVPLYTPNDPYHWSVDNIPLNSLMRRQNLINLALDNVIEQMRDAIGTQGSVANRLNQSIEADGSLKKAAVDDVLHSIESHADTDDYVRMAKAESDKLALVSDGATDVTVTVNTDSGDVEFTAGEVRLEPSSTVTFSVESPNKIKANMAFSTDAAHQHQYSQVPVHVTPLSPDNIHYKVNAASTAYIEGSLRVFINGVRLDPNEEIYIPGYLVTDPWTLLTYTEDYSNGKFALSAAISDDDVIMIDYDIQLV